MLFNQRIIHNDGGTLVDLSKELSDLFAGAVTVGIVAADDKLYIGSDLPFNHRYFNVSVANDQVSAISEVAIWDGGAWTPAVDVVDQTSVSGCTLGQSGIVSFTVNRNSSWALEASTEDMTGSGLTALKIYDMYWVRLTFSGNLKATTALKYVGHRFSTDSDLGGQYPDLLKTDVLTAFETGKTTWEPQHVLATEAIILGLRKAKKIWSANQLMAWEQFNSASVHKTAEICYAAFGSEEYEAKRKTAEKKFKEDMAQLVVADEDADGRADEVERRGGEIGLYRS
jgi:hypothetical protein